MTTELFIIRLVTSFICSIAFAVIFKTATRHLIPAGLAGVAVYFVYHIVLYPTCEAFFAAAFLSTLAGGAMAEIYARLRRAPVTVILFAAIIPIVPGGDLYYTMQKILRSEWEEALRYFGQTMAVALGIAGGIVVASLAFRIFFEKLAQYKKKKGKG